MKETNEKAVKPMSQDRERIGKMIRSIREQQKMDAKTLAEKAGIDSGNLCRIEQGKYSVGLDVLCKVVYPLGYKVDLVPIVSTGNQIDKLDAKKNKRRYNDVPLELLKPIKDYDYQSFWVTSKELQLLGIDMDALDPSDRFQIERDFTFSRSVYFGNSRSIFNYGQLTGLYVYHIMSEGTFISSKNREIIYSVCNFVCNLISNDFVKEVSKVDDFVPYLHEALEYFENLTAKWMYMNDFTSENQKYALAAAEYAISTRLNMIPIEEMINDVYDYSVKFNMDISDYIITEVPQRSL